MRFVIRQATVVGFPTDLVVDAPGGAGDMAPMLDTTDVDAQSQFAISARELRKTYAASGKSPAKEALKGIDLSIKRGSIFGLLGPNGAGKSTFINILAGLVNKTAGSVNVWGFEIDKNARQVRAALGIVPQEINMDVFFHACRSA